MNKYLFHCAFKGTCYKGWQRQKNVPTVQERLESCFEQVFGRHINVHGCGRTDTGVHASQFFFHAKIPKPELSGDKLFILNKNLPEDISLFNIIEVSPEFNAQHSALSRTYHYHLHLNRDPLLSDLSTYLIEDPEDTAIFEGLTILLGKHDFRAFSLTPDQLKHTYCTIQEARFLRSPDRKQLCFTFTADRFIRTMVRQLVDELIQIGLRKRTMKQFETRLANQVPNPLAKPAYPQGLYLAAVEYPALSLARIAKEPFETGENL